MLERLRAGSLERRLKSFCQDTTGPPENEGGGGGVGGTGRDR